MVFPEHWDQVLCLGALLGLRKLYMCLWGVWHLEHWQSFLITQDFEIGVWQIKDLFEPCYMCPTPQLCCAPSRLFNWLVKLLFMVCFMSSLSFPSCLVIMLACLSRAEGVRLLMSSLTGADQNRADPKAAIIRDHYLWFCFPYYSLWVFVLWTASEAGVQAAHSTFTRDCAAS